MSLLATASAALSQVGSPPSVVADAILRAEFRVSEAELFGHVTFLADPAMNGRDAGSAEGAIAGNYIAAEFTRLGLVPAGDNGTFWQSFERVKLVGKAEPANDGKPALEQRTLTCRNVLAWLPGSDPKFTEEFVLIGAHYDHLGRRGDAVFHGADDNASGTAGLLGIARALVNGPVKPRRSVLFVAFDAEEIGLAGAETFARKPARTLQQLVAMLNLDMIGRSRLLDRKSMALGKRLVGIPDAPAVGVIGTSQSPELSAAARAVFAADGLPLFAPENFGMLASIIEKQAEGRADHAPFERRKIPFLFFSTSEHDDYHQPTDTIDKIDRQTMWRIAANTYRTLLAIDASDTRPTFVDKAAATPAKGGNAR